MFALFWRFGNVVLIDTYLHWEW